MELKDIIIAMIVSLVSIAGHIIVKAYQPTKGDIKKYANVMLRLFLFVIVPILFIKYFVDKYPEVDKTFVVVVSFFITLSIFGLFDLVSVYKKNN